MEITGGCGGGSCERSEPKIFFTPPLEGVFFAYEHPPAVFSLPFNAVQGPRNFVEKSRKNAKHRRNRTRGMRAQILNPREPPVLLENRKELKLIRNTDGAYVNILVIA